MKLRDLMAIIGVAVFAAACSPATQDNGATNAADQSDSQDSDDEGQGKSRGPGE